MYNLFLKLILVCCGFAGIHSHNTYEEVKENVTFILLTKSMTEYNSYDFSNGSQIVNDTSFVASKQTIFFFSGFTEIFDKHEPNRSYSYICPELLAQNKSNVIVVNYGYFLELKETPLPNFLKPIKPLDTLDDLVDLGYSFLRAFSNSNVLARVITDFIINCFALNTPDLLPNLHFVGFSMGAHIAGMVGNNIANSTNKQIFLITACDPAGPLYDFLQLDIFQLYNIKRLNEDDAVRVVAIHTDRYVYGSSYRVGYLDYWLNKDGSRPQPNCTSSILNLEDPCSHYYSCELLACSIKSVVYPARLCDNYKDYQKGKCDNNTISYLDNSVNLTSPYGNYYLNAIASCL